MPNRYSNITANLGENEIMHIRLRPAWQYFWKCFLLILLILFVTDNTSHEMSGNILALSVLMLTVFVRYRVLYIFTSKRVIMQIGLIAKNTNEVEIRHAREFSVRQGIAGRLLNYGTIEVSSAAGTGPEVIFNGITSPHDLKETIRLVRNGR